MRLTFLALAMLMLAACVSTPKPIAEPVQPAPGRTPTGTLVGLTATELSARFGPPALQVREGDSSKIQFRGPTCVLDAYLYTPENGPGIARVAHVDTRNREGRSVDQASCMAIIGTR